MLPVDGEEFVSVLTELLFELHVAATPDKLNKVHALILHTPVFIDVLLTFTSEIHLTHTNTDYDSPHRFLSQARMKAYDWIREMENPVSEEEVKEETLESPPTGQEDASEIREERREKMESATEESKTDKVEVSVQ